MRFAFFGSPLFARIVLEQLLEHGYTPKALICNPDRPAGRTRTITPPATKTLIHDKGLTTQIRIVQPSALDEPFARELASLTLDLGVVAAYAKILPAGILTIPARGMIGVHPSLLPRYRGSSPIQSALIAGEEETGVTLYRMDARLDHGPILAARRVRIAPEDTTATLTETLAREGGKLLAEILPTFMRGELFLETQDETHATATKKFATDDAYVRPEDLAAAQSGKAPESAARIHRMIRALNPEPGVWTLQNGKRMKLLAAELARNALVLSLIQMEGKKPSPFRPNA